VNAVAVLRRIALDPQAGTHLVLQPGATRVVQPAHAHAGDRQAAAEGQLLGLEHYLPGEAGRLGGRILVDPFAVALGIDAGAGNEQQTARLLFMLSQPAKHVAQPLDIGLAIAGLIMLGGGRGIDQIIQPAVGPAARTGGIGQVALDRQDRHRQLGGVAPQTVHPPAVTAELQAQTTAHVAATGDQYAKALAHLLLPQWYPNAGRMHWSVPAFHACHWLVKGYAKGYACRQSDGC